MRLKRHRFFIDQPLTSGHIMLDDKELVRQIGEILKMKAGEELVLLDGSGREALCIISDVSKRTIGLDALELAENSNESERAVTLYAAIAKGDTFEWIAEKAAEVGVKRIVPIITARTVKREVRTDRLLKIMKEAAEVSGRGAVPALGPVMTFAEALKDVRNNETNIIFDLDGGIGITTLFCHPPMAIGESREQKTNKIGVFIGPEGGWNEEELATAQQAGLTATSLGQLTLRAETAAAIATYLAVHL